MVTLKELIDNCPEFGTVTLKGDMSEAVTVNNRRLTINMGGFSWTAPEASTPLTISGNGTITLENGTISSSKAPCVSISCDENTTCLDIRDGVTMTAAEYSAVVLGKNATMRSLGNISNTGPYGAIQRSFSDPKTKAYLDVYGGTVTAAGSAGILWPSEGEVTIHGGTITGLSGIEMRAGALRVHGGNITATGSGLTSKSAPTGSSVSGAGIAVSQLNEKAVVAVDITRGQVAGAVAFADVNPESVVKGRENVNLEIAGGEFTIVGGGSDVVVSVDQVDFIIEGSFSKAPDKKYLSIGTYLENRDGTVMALRPNWEYPEGGAVGLGFNGNRRLIYHVDKVNYPPGGFSLKFYGFNPVALISANAVGGVVAYFDAANQAVHLYRGGAELTGEVRDLTLVLIGN